MKNYRKNILTGKVQIKDGSNLCLYPFFNLMMNADGTYKACCKIRENITHNGKELNASANDINEAKNADSLLALREAFLLNKRPDACTVCWQEEASGIRSMRYDSYNYNIKEDHLTQIKEPVRLDIYPSNVCNLKCRICSPGYSTRWIEEARDTMGIEEDVHMNLTDKNMDWLIKWLPHIREIGLFGGEPLFIRECIKIMEHAVDMGYSSHIRLLINTNATMYSPKLVALFQKFEKVLLNFSIDDIGQRFEYQRSGAIWDHVVKNIHKYLVVGGISESSKVECKMCCTLSAINIYYLPEYIEWLPSEFPGMRVFLNLLHGPYSLCMYNLPAEIKEKIKDRLQKIPLSKISFDEDQTRTLQNVIDFLMTEPNVAPHLFWEEVTRGDKYRNEDFEHIFPEFANILVEYRDSIIYR